MSDDRDHTIATATVTSEETPYGVRINTGGHALRGDEPVATHATERPGQGVY